jgi:hypothetical protein
LQNISKYFKKFNIFRPFSGQFLAFLASFYPFWFHLVFAKKYFLENSGTGQGRNTGVTTPCPAPPRAGWVEPSPYNRNAVSKDVCANTFAVSLKVSAT